MHWSYFLVLLLEVSSGWILLKKWIVLLSEVYYSSVPSLLPKQTLWPFQDCSCLKMLDFYSINACAFLRNGLHKILFSLLIIKEVCRDWGQKMCIKEKCIKFFLLTKKRSWEHVGKIAWISAWLGSGLKLLIINLQPFFCLSLRFYIYLPLI